MSFQELGRSCLPTVSFPFYTAYLLTITAYLLTECLEFTNKCMKILDYSQKFHLKSKCSVKTALNEATQPTFQPTHPSKLKFWQISSCIYFPLWTFIWIFSWDLVLHYVNFSKIQKSNLGLKGLRFRQTNPISAYRNWIWYTSDIFHLQRGVIDV